MVQILGAVLGDLSKKIALEFVNTSIIQSMLLPLMIDQKLYNR